MKWWRSTAMNRHAFSDGLRCLESFSKHNSTIALLNVWCWKIILFCFFFISKSLMRQTMLLSPCLLDSCFSTIYFFPSKLCCCTMNDIITAFNWRSTTLLKCHSINVTRMSCLTIFKMHFFFSPSGHKKKNTSVS